MIRALRIMFICLSLACFPVSFQSFASGDIETTAEFTISFDLEFSSDEFNPYLDGDLRLSISDDIATDSYAQVSAILSTNKNNHFQLKEVYLDMYFESVDLRIGNQRIAWGKADGINPTDNFNPIDYSRPFAEDNRIEVPALRAKYYYEDWIVDFVWVPLFTSAKFPESGERWVLDANLLPSLPGYELNSVDIKPIIEPENKLTNSELGIRLSRWSANIDASISYFHGWIKEPIPHITTEIVAPGLVDMIIEPKYHQVDVIGADFAKDFGNFILRGEAGYFIPEEELNARNPYFSYVLGFDTYPSDKSYLNIQLFGEKENQQEGELGITISYQYDITDLSKLEINGVYNFQGKDFLINPQYRQDISDDLSLTIGAYIFTGEVNTDFGSLDEKDFIFLKLKKTF